MHTPGGSWCAARCRWAGSGRSAGTGPPLPVVTAGHVARGPPVRPVASGSGAERGTSLPCCRDRSCPGPLACQVLPEERGPHRARPTQPPPRSAVQRCPAFVPVRTHTLARSSRRPTDRVAGSSGGARSGEVNGGRPLPGWVGCDGCAEVSVLLAPAPVVPAWWRLCLCRLCRGARAVMPALAPAVLRYPRRWSPCRSGPRRQPAPGAFTPAAYATAAVIPATYAIALVTPAAHASAPAATVAYSAAPVSRRVRQACPRRQPGTRPQPVRDANPIRDVNPIRGLRPARALSPVRTARAPRPARRWRVRAGSGSRCARRCWPDRFPHSSRCARGPPRSAGWCGLRPPA